MMEPVSTPESSRTPGPEGGAKRVIKPGVVLRYHDHANALRTGIVRSTNVSMQFPVLTQSLEVESHA